MNKTLLAPLLLGSLFAVAAAAEIVQGEPAARSDAPALALRPPAPAVIRTVDAAQDGMTILSRPLFNADRRPVSEKHGPAAATTPPRLSAILVSATTKQVVFDDGGKPVVAREGGHAGPYTILSIGADRVTVFSAEGQRTLRPTPIPSDENGASTTTASQETAPASGLSLLQQLQRGQVPHYAVPPPPTIQSLIARMRAQH